MAEQLKIVIDADVQKAVAGVQNLSKVITSDFVKATNSAAAAASNLSKEVNASVQKINTALAGLKITSLDVTVNTASIDASIKNIQSKFSALVDPQLNVLANTEQAELRIKELISELSALRGSEIFIRANDTQALQKINEIETELKSLSDKQIKLNITTTGTGTQDAVESVKKLDTTWREFVGQRMGAYMKQLGSHGAAIKQIAAEWKDFKANLGTQIKPNIDTGSLKEASKVIALDFPKATQVAETAFFDLSGRAAAATSRINAFVDKMVADALGQVNKLKTSFETIKTPSLNFGVLSFDSSKALAEVQKFKAELGTIAVKPIAIPVNSYGITDVIQKIKALEAQLINLESLKVTPGISSTQLALFEANIKRIKAEISSLKTQALVVPIGVDTTKAQANVNLLSETIETLRAKIEARKSFITVETDITKIAAYNKEIERLEARMRSIQNVGKKGFELFIVPNQTIQSVKSLSESVAKFGGGVRTFIPPAIAGFTKLNTSVHPIIGSLKSLEAQAKTSGAAMGSAFTKSFGALRSLAALIPGIGLGGLIGIAASAVDRLTSGFFEAAFGASKLDKAIDDATGSIDSNAAKTIVLVKALQSGTLSTQEFRKAKKELIDISPEFQSSFDGDKIKIDESKIALDKYIQNLVKTVKVTAALGIVNEKLAKSLATIAKGGDVSFGEQITAFFESFGDLGTGLRKVGETGLKNLEDAKKALTSESISKLIEDTFKSLGITFSDVANDVTKGGAKVVKAIGDIQGEIIARAKLAAKAFGDAFVVPDLEETFFKNKQAVLKEAKKFITDVDSFVKGNTGALKIKIPVITEFDFLPISEGVDQSVIDNFFKGIQLERKIPVGLTVDPKSVNDLFKTIDQSLDLKKQFSIFGDFGIEEFQKVFQNIDFDNITQIQEGIKTATERLAEMRLVADTLAQSVGQGLSNAFNSVFDAILEGKNVFKALGNAIKQLVVDTIKAVAQMLILKAVTNFIFPGAGAGFSLPRGQFVLQSNTGGLGLGNQIGSQAFTNTINVVVNGQISGQNILLAGQRASGSNIR
jgi:hypothetical protein